eukprot:TRINITY_DN13252_c0_g1_i3.p1 TRINITY_DN13252_c0_g1~~TRINITY_DN13252_c0_g1_i3.p1  ORF type:complete len:574 (+),score=107.98 TRINITY_DN13252_c0_g1_i3:65-1786(+)
MNSLADLAAMRQMPTDTSIPGWDHPRRRDTSELGRHAKSDCARRRSLVDEKLRMEEKLKSFESKAAQQLLDTVAAGDEFRMRAGHISDHGAYQVFMAACTLLSVFFVAVETDHHASGEPLPDIVQTCGIALLLIFSIDFGVRLYVYRVHFWLNFLNIFEGSLIVMDLTLLFLPTLPNLLAALKILRFVRLQRVLRQLAQLRELYLMMMGIMASVRALAFGGMLLFMTLTMFSILAVYFVRETNHELYEAGAFGDCEYCEDSFDTVMKANLWFLTSIVAGDSWGTQAVPLVRCSMGAAVVMVGALVLVNLGLLNTIAAVIVDRQAQARVDDAEFMAVVHAEELVGSLAVLQTAFHKMDADGGNTLGLEELMTYYDDNDMFRTILNRLDIHKADVPIIFNILDTDNTKDLSFVEFVNGLHRLKNENAHTLAIFTKHFAEKMYEGWGDISDLQSMVQKQEDALRLLIKRFNNVDHISSSPEASPRSSDGNALADIVKAATLAQPPDDQLPEPFVFAEKSPRSPQLSEGGEEEAPQSFPLSLSPALLSAKPDCVRLGNAQGFRTTWTAEVVEEECAS